MIKSIENNIHAYLNQKNWGDQLTFLNLKHPDLGKGPIGRDALSGSQEV